MSTEYAGISVFPTTITVLQDGDESPAASVAVALEQLADRTRWLWTVVTGGTGAEFTGAILHGNTSFPDGTITAVVDSISLTAGVSTVAIAAATDISIGAFGGTAFFGGNVVSIGSSTSVAVAGTSFDVMTGKIHVTPSLIVLGDDVNLGASTADGILCVGTFQANHNAIFVAGKTVTMSGVTTVDDLRSVVSTAGGVTYSGGGYALYRHKLIVDADMAGGPYPIHPSIADIFYVDSLAASNALKMHETGVPTDAVVEISTYAMTGGFNLEIYREDEVTLLLTMTATGNSWSRWIKKASGGWRCLGVSDG